MNPRFTVALIFSMFLVLSSSLTFQSALALDPFVRITGGSYPPNNRFMNSGSFPMPAPSQVTTTAVSTVRITMTFTGADDNNRISRFECSWDGSPYSGTNCTALPERRQSLQGLNGTTRNHYVRDGSAFKDLRIGPHTFNVRVVNDAGTVRASPTPWSFTITAPEITQQPQPIDTTLPIRSDVYKSYSGYSSRQPVYHTEQGRIVNGVVTPHNNIYIVLEGIYGGTSDAPFHIDTARTTFTCRWDGGTIESCGRFNVLTNLSPGLHSVDFQARSPTGVFGAPSHLDWCVSPTGVTCEGTIVGPNFRAISSSNLRSYINETQVNMESPAQANMESPAQANMESPAAQANMESPAQSSGTQADDNTATDTSNAGQIGPETSGDAPGIDMPSEPAQDLTGGSESGEKGCGPNEDFDSKSGKCEPQTPG